MLTVMNHALQIISWPDPRLKRVAKPVTAFDADLRDIVDQMLYLMHQAKGVGLAAPQVGLNMRLFVISPTGQPEDDKVYVNPELNEAEGEQTDEEGCLSLPNIRAQIVRSQNMKIRAQDLDGKPFEEIAEGYVARIWQHENDHLNGILITERMGLGDRLKYRRALKDLQEEYDLAHPKKPAARKPAAKNNAKAR